MTANPSSITPWYKKKVAVPNHLCLSLFECKVVLYVWIGCGKRGGFYRLSSLSKHMGKSDWSLYIWLSDSNPGDMAEAGSEAYQTYLSLF